MSILIPCAAISEQACYFTRFLPLMMPACGEGTSYNHALEVDLPLKLALNSEAIAEH